MAKLVAEYLQQNGQAEADRLFGYAQRHRISDAEIRAAFEDHFAHERAREIGGDAGLPRLAIGSPSTREEAQSPSVFGALLGLAGGLARAGATVATSAACIAADIFIDPIAKLGEVVVQSATDATLSGDRAGAAAWLARRGLGENEQRAILAIVSRAAYWHGTGRYQYSVVAADKYQGVSDSVADKLQQILAAGGLTPHFDPYYESGASDGATVSLAHCRMYARYYAQIHQSAGHDLDYEYGAAGDWVTLVGAHLGVSGIGEVILTYATAGTQPAVEKWARSVHRSPSLTGIVTGVQRSDIRGNHGILFGIRKSVSLVRLESRMRRVEARSAHRIAFEDMTHVEVPADKVAATTRRLRALGLELPVLAMEDVEAVLSRFSTSQLVENKLGA